MSDNEKNIGSREEFEGKEVRNTMPQIDENAYDQISQKGKNIRNFDDEEFGDDEEEMAVADEDNEIINSLLDFSNKNFGNAAPQVEEKKSKFSFGKKKDSESSEKESKFSFGKKKVETAPVEEIPVVDDISSSPTEEELENHEDFETVDPIDFEEPAKKSIGGKFLNKKTDKKKKSSLFGKKNKDTEEVVDTNDFDNIENEEVDDTYVNTIEDIERDIRKAKKKSFKGDKKLYMILGGVLAIIVFVVVLVFFLGGDNNTPTVPVPQNPVVEIPEKEDGFVSGEVNNISYKQGIIKRILGNKILIVPDGETENTIYYIDNVDIVDGFKAGNHIEYGYVIKNYLPYIVEMISIKEGTIAYKGIMTVNIMVNDTLVKFAYDSSLEEEIKNISTGDVIQYVYEEIDGVPTITYIINVNKAQVEDDVNNNQVINPSDNPMTDNLYTGYIYDAKDFYNEHMIIDSRNENAEIREATKSQIKDNTIYFYNGIDNPIWIRHAWRSTDIMESVPSIENVSVILETPSGIQITNDNIAQYGRMWIDGNILNYALKNPEIGEYKLIDNKPKGTFLGEAGLHVMELSGFITIDKFGANLIDRNTLELVWNIGGVPDDGLEIEVYLTNDRFSTMVYSGSSKDAPLHIIDKKTVSISNLPKGKYNVVVTVKDIDMKTQADDPQIPENTIVIAAETISETKNVGILILQ